MSYLFIILLIGVVIYQKWDMLSDNYNRLAGTEDVTDKATAIRAIADTMRKQNITLVELTRAMSETPNMSANISARKQRNAGDVAMKVFGWLGAIFILAGISTYIAMFWATMPSFMRIFLTLGTGIGLSVLSAIALKEGKYPRIILPLIFLAAITETVGWFVLVDELFSHSGNIHKAASLIFAIMTVQQCCMFINFRRTDILLTVMVFTYGFFSESLRYMGMKEEYILLLLGGCMIYSSFILTRTPHRILSRPGYVFGACWFNAGFFMYMESITKFWIAIILTGLSFCSMAYGLREAKNSHLSELGFLVGSAMVYAGLFDWLHYKPYELGFLGVAVFMLYGAAVIQSRAILLTSALAILSFIGDYTEEHFINSIGWPIALILMGVVFFAVSALTVKIKRKYQL